MEWFYWFNEINKNIFIIKWIGKQIKTKQNLSHAYRWKYIGKWGSGLIIFQYFTNRLIVIDGNCFENLHIDKCLHRSALHLAKESPSIIRIIWQYDVTIIIDHVAIMGVTVTLQAIITLQNECKKNCWILIACMAFKHRPPFILTMCSDVISLKRLYIACCVNWKPTTQPGASFPASIRKMACDAITLMSPSSLISSLSSCGTAYTKLSLSLLCCNTALLYQVSSIAFV